MTFVSGHLYDPFYLSSVFIGLQPTKGTIGDTERKEVAWCTKSGRGTRTIPNKTLKGVHFVQTPDYVQVTGVGDFTSMNIPNKDEYVADLNVA